MSSVFAVASRPAATSKRLILWLVLMAQFVVVTPETDSAAEKS